MSGGRESIALDERLVERLLVRAGASAWGVSHARFAGVLARAAAKAFADRTPSPDTLDAFLNGLHLEDLALATACADGHDAAWEVFVSRHRADLRRAAMAIAGSADGVDLADALYADLFGLDARGTGRRSLFEYFHGRSRLSTWLRALLARRHIDAMRVARRTQSLDAVEQPDDLLPAVAAPADPDRARLVEALQNALREAFAQLDPRDRLRLSCYHTDGLTLARIGRMLGEHEATVSRKLQRTREDVRAAVARLLRERLGLSADDVDVCFRYAVEDGMTVLGLSSLGLSSDGPAVREGAAPPVQSSAVQTSPVQTNPAQPGSTQPGAVSS